jgi:hypothetical protein
LDESVGFHICARSKNCAHQDLSLSLEHQKQHCPFDLVGIYENVTLEKPDINFAHTARAPKDNTEREFSNVFVCADDASFSRAVVFHFAARPLRMFTEWRKENSWLSPSCARAPAHQKNKALFTQRGLLQNSPCCYCSEP